MVRTLAPGLALSLAVAAVAMGLQTFETRVFDRIWLEGLVLAILIGAGVRTLWPPPEAFLGQDKDEVTRMADSFDRLEAILNQGMIPPETDQ